MLREPAIDRAVVRCYLDAATKLAAVWGAGAATGPVLVEAATLLPIEGITTRGNYRVIHDLHSGINALWKTESVHNLTKIVIALPVTGLPSTEGSLFCVGHISYLAGVAVHEYVHWLQKQNWVDDYNSYARKQTDWRKSLGSRPPSADELNQIYYSNEFEIAAHAAQAAVEMKTKDICFEATELFLHIRQRLGGGELSADVRAQFDEAVGRYVKGIT
ncbi:hypothetical protein [Acidisphaera sp. S103]|uniref:hypothetical protein n=1 Tax=Acidisphaera sp. S103 TaxID=1747223 RepID=UPI00131C5230|nr:hypothetical protein [Acidisphaera sp. S103]